ncbi:thermonuclease family protein [Microbacterium sp. SSW1-47]|uniref:thermonuclease family protein n=1 Tax=Microbacterium sufflavum TaxID=2851649 RepID=UPI001FFDA546|nr:thermonuclease family protein [Microbacterium sufflavum]MCK2028064.1 thermonuclease family protein [Microbacterium sufflavum]
MTARSCTLTLAAAAVALALTSCTPAEISTTPAATTTATVVAVVDGDTIDVQTSTGEERVRLIGIDTPEISRDGGADDCYAQEARTYLDQLVHGHDVELVSDPTQADTDQYGRLLRHVLIEGQSAAQLAIEAGAGTEYTYDTPYDRRSDYLAAQDRAQDASAGLWSACP